MMGFRGSHSETYRVWLAGRDDLRASADPLPLKSGSLDWSLFTAVQGGGSLEFHMPLFERDEEWAGLRILVDYEARLGEQVLAYPIMVGIVSDARGNSIEILDKTAILDRASFRETFSVAAGDNAIERVRFLIESVGETRHALPDSDETIIVPMSWQAGTSRLRIANDLLDAAAMEPLRVDGSGMFITSPRAEYGSPVWDFSSDDQAVHEHETPNDRNMLDVPNRIVCISTTDGEEEPLISVVDNDDPLSPWSIPNVGIVTRVIDGIDVTSQAALDEIARSYLNSSSQVTWRQTISHLRLRLWLGDSVTGASGQTARIVEMQQRLEAGALTKTIVRRMDRMVTA